MKVHNQWNALRNLKNVSKIFKKFPLRFAFLLGLLIIPLGFFAQEKVMTTDNVLSFPFINFQGAPEGSQAAFSLQLLLILTVISLAPSILVLMTSFLRISIVLDFIRRGLSLQTTPPNAVIMGLSLFLTLFLMWPTFSKIYENAYKPLSNNEIAFDEFYDRSMEPLRFFMYNQMQNSRHKEIRFFMKMANLPAPQNFSEVPTYVLIPSFVIHELTVAFKMGVLIMLPFIVIDLIVSTILMAMGMIMLPPVVISLPFKLLVFVLVDGWSLISLGVLQSFRL